MRKITLIAAILMLTLLLSNSIAAQGLTKDYHFQDINFSLPLDYQEEKTKYRDISASFISPDTNLKVFIEPLKNNVTAQSYINYGNWQLDLGKAGFKIVEKNTLVINGYNVIDIAYYRPLITTLNNDQNFYREVHVIDQNEQRAITFWAKTVGANYSKLKNELYDTVKSISKANFKKNDFFSSFTIKSQPIKYEGAKLKMEIPVNKLLWGRFYPGVPFDAQLYQQMIENEQYLEHKFEFIMTYKMFPVEEPFPSAAIQRVYDEGRVLMLTLQPFTPDLNWIAIPEIAAGKYDAKIKEWAQDLKSINEPVFVRPLNEMNGDWDPWCAWFFGKDTDLYIKAWRHMVDLFREVGADNVLFVWNPHDRSYPDFQWNNSHLYYPGDEYVDWVGLTGYNNGTSHPGDVWREFDEIYQPLYIDYLKRYHNKPFMITEFSSNEIGGDKAAWITKGMASLAQEYPNIKIATWFDGRDKLWQYQLKSSEAALEGFKNGLKNEAFIKGAVNNK